MGMVILAAIQDHKVYIATGYGMEGVVTGYYCQGDRRK